MTGQPIWRERLKGVGVLNADEALALSATGPILRSHRLAWDLRRDSRTSPTTESRLRRHRRFVRRRFDRYAIRLNEIRESMRSSTRSSRHADGDYRIQDKKVTPPPRVRIDQSMEALIHHFKIFTEGFKVPEGEAYAAVESPRGETRLSTS